MIIKNLTATCKRCLGQGKATNLKLDELTIEVWDWMNMIPMGVTSYTGVIDLEEHHRASREHGVAIKGNDNHNDFFLF